jgi:hypothetical protein
MYIFILLCSSILAENVVASEQANPPEPTVWKCDKPFLFGFGSWDRAPKAFAVRPDGIHIVAKNDLRPVVCMPGAACQQALAGLLLRLRFDAGLSRLLGVVRGSPEARGP